MSSKTVVVIAGDGVGEEITAAAKQVLQAAARRFGLNINYSNHLAGGAALDKYGEPLPTATVQAAKQADAVLLGAVGGPRWDNVPPHLRAEKAILGLRQELGLYANLRPVRVMPAMVEHSPLKAVNVVDTDILIVRELNGGIYYGPRQERHLVAGKEQAWDTEIYSVPEVERLVRLACRLARQRRRHLTSVDKANVLASSRLWRATVNKVAEEFPDINLQHLYVDNCAMQLVLAPRQFDVLVTSNLFGDILSDEAAVLTGSIGMLPSASLGDGPGLFEPIHGSAPDIAGQGIANPIGAILSAALLLRYALAAEPAARAVEQAVEHVLAEGYRTADIYSPGTTKVSTEEMANLITRAIV